MKEKPLQAIQFNGIDDYLKVVDWMRSLGVTTADECRFSSPEMSIQTDRGTESARPGDWIVKNADGRFYVRRSHILLTSANCPCRNRTSAEFEDTDRPPNCEVCDGIIGICSLCGAVEIELLEPCAAVQQEVTTFGALPVGTWFRTARSPAVAKIKTGFNRWKWAHHEGFLPVSNGAASNLEVIRIDPFDESSD